MSSNKLDQILDRLVVSAARMRRRRNIISAVSIGLALITLIVMITPAIATTSIAGGDVQMESAVDVSLADNAGSSEAPAEDKTSDSLVDQAPSGSDGWEPIPEAVPAADSDSQTGTAAVNTAPLDTNSAEPASTEAASAGTTAEGTMSVNETVPSGEESAPAGSTPPDAETESAQTVDEAVLTEDQSALTEDESALADEALAGDETETKKEEKTSAGETAEPVWITSLEGEDSDNGVKVVLSFDSELRIEEGTELTVHFVQSGDGDPETDGEA